MIAFGRARRALLGALVVAAAIVPVSWAPAVCAAEIDGAALVVDTGQRVRSLCVVIGDGSVSGLDLIRLASEQHGLDYALGFGGEAVCRLDGVGVDGDDCFAQFPSFWGYWRGDGSGGWRWSSVGGGSTVVQAGDVEGWSWGEGADGSTHPAPPGTTAAEVCPEPEPSPAGSGSGDGGNDGSAGAEASGGGAGDDVTPETAAGAEEESTERGGGDRDEERGKERSEHGEDEREAAAVEPPAEDAESMLRTGAEETVEGDRASSSSSGRSIAGPIVAVAAAGVLAGAALIVARRRRRRSD